MCAQTWLNSMRNKQFIKFDARYVNLHIIWATEINSIEFCMKSLFLLRQYYVNGKFVSDTVNGRIILSKKHQMYPSFSDSRGHQVTRDANLAWSTPTTYFVE